MARDKRTEEEIAAAAELEAQQAQAATEEAEQHIEGVDPFASDGAFEDLTTADQILVQVIYGVAADFITTTILETYTGKPISELMYDVVEAPPDSAFWVDNDQVPPTWEIPEGFAPQRLTAVKATGTKG